MKITIPNNNLQERQYILDILFTEFLGLDFEIKTNDSIPDWIIEFNSSKLIFKDDFFHQFKDNLSYLKLENLPKKVNYVSNDFIVEADIPILYGNDELSVKENEIYCGIDIFASSFFMLTRWEEYVNENRDNHNRFFAIESIAFKNNFLDRPIVNEYVEMLWNMLVHLGYSQQRKERKFSFMTTHDVDVPLRYRGFFPIIKMVGGEILKRRNFKKGISIFLDACMVKLKIRKDPFDTFDYFMNLSEKADVKSYFFFMGKGQTKYDNFYRTDDKFIKKLVEKIKKREHHIGMHPTYNAYNQKEQFEQEKQELEKNLSTQIKFGREHYLRFEVPATWQIWEDNNMEWDSTLGHADKEGFRCGTCYEFPVFNFLTRRQLKLIEKPLIVMEGSFTTYQPNITPEYMQKIIEELIKKVQKYNGTFVFLWHNSTFNTPEIGKYEKVYKNILSNQIKSNLI